jgi:hypothetical protein
VGHCAHEHVGAAPWSSCPMSGPIGRRPPGRGRIPPTLIGFTGALQNAILRVLARREPSVWLLSRTDDSPHVGFGRPTGCDE